MGDPIGKLFFPLATLKLPRVFKTGESWVDVQVTRSGGGYTTSMHYNGKPLKLTLEKTDQNSFSRGLLHFYYFREPEKQYTAARQFLARMGFHNKEPLEMEYADQKYKYKFLADQNGSMREMQMFFSPVVGRMVVRAV